ncbi:hypothetical protein CXF97_14405 [Pseudomonas sp. Choline-02u-1]|uniref:hypothetical protein n=1 Tax=Pseudomonas sp. Choline-02u-1 TaxID=2058307 RepID=UPI000C31BA36|nr:hypothetical protein [Pseudomonas sp. Choline-02u-1]PKH80127.1 hypothetical protein CXF97_14405 [Pseudomonas sp. Choline-02u-1]
MRKSNLAALTLATLLSATSFYATAASDTPAPTANDGNSQANPSAPEDIHSNGTVPKGTQGNTTNNDGSTPSGSKPSGSKQSNDSGTSSGAGKG